jgi:arsenical-resistance protein 2
VTLLSQIPKVIFHCNSCSETGRGPRAAGWYTMELQKRGIETSQAWVLDGGVKRFGEIYGNDEKLVSKL